MGRYWWTVWIKVAILAVVLLLAYQTVSGFVKESFAPYLLETPATDAPADTDEAVDGEIEDADLVAVVMGQVQNLFGVNLDYESFIYDFANGFAQQMIEDSNAEHNVVNQPLS